MSASRQGAVDCHVTVAVIHVLVPKKALLLALTPAIHPAIDIQGFIFH